MVDQFRLALYCKNKLDASHSEGQSLAYKPEIDVIFIGKESECAKLSAHKTELFQFKQN